ncbi:PREDICTED: uncharacterized protein LOC106115303 [Papilio xuthus]|uniref:Uncharacterized protein LOC106115303 n=1 Tax=Papilio xuthus TaxID=66420 RepID=A0AAJ7E5R1_PAPXU|nr:PREDICTED: uncharacterized protein LOC106115303 [Papilio xuthus]
MKTPRKSSKNIMRKYYQLILVLISFISIVTLLIYRHEYYRLRYVLEVLNFFGKPGLSEIEFCGPGFNATMLSEILRNSSMEVRETPPLFQQIDENFYSYSSFLRSYQKYQTLTPSYAHSIDTIVIGKTNVNPAFRCNIWFENESKPKAGRFTHKVIVEHVNFTVYVFRCITNKDFGKPKGISFYVNDYNINPIHAPINRLIEVNTKRKPRKMSNIKFVNNIVPAICVLPNRVPIVSRDSFIEFLVFHQMMGVNYFTIYDSTISEDVIRRLNLLPSDITQWNIQFFPLNYPFIFSKSYYIVRIAVELDCLFRHFQYDKEEADKVSHVIVLSWDEFLVPRVHDNIKSVIGDFDPMRSLQMVAYTLLFCLNQPKDDNAVIGYPDIFNKRHYFNLPDNTPFTHIRNLDAISTFDEIFNISLEKMQVIPEKMLAAHKYTECRDSKKYSLSGYNETQLQVFPHKLEGAMTQFSQELLSNRVYRLYKSGQIWERSSSENVRDML